MRHHVRHHFRRQYASWLDQHANAGQFSGAVLVADAHGTLLDAGYGLADRATHAANAPQTQFCVASIGELFTAVAIAQLAQQHKLSFQHPSANTSLGCPR